MSVINIRGRVTDSETSFNTSAYSDQSLVLTNSEKNRIEAFSLELSVGDAWALTYSSTKKQLNSIPDAGIEIPSRGSVVVKVKERIRMPHNLYGVILPTGSLFLSSGILIAPAKIEPSFSGHLKLRLFNTTQVPHHLGKGDKLASAIFFQTEVTVHNEEITRDSDVAANHESRISKVWSWTKLNRVAVIGWCVTLIGSSLVSSIGLYFLYYKPMIEKANSMTSTQIEATINARLGKLGLLPPPTQQPSASAEK